MNLTLGKFRLSNLASGREQVIDFGIKNQISHNVKSDADLAGLSLLLAARTVAVSSSTNTILNLPALLQGLASP